MDELKEKIEKTIRNEWGSRICGITPMGLFPCKSGATCACGQTASAILNMIEEAGYVLTRKQQAEGATHGCEPMSPAEAAALYGRWPIRAECNARPPYATLADSATSFDPEKQFEKDRE